MKKRRRSTPAGACAFLSDGLLIAVSFKSISSSQSHQSSGWPRASLGQRKGLGFQFHKDPADAADGTVEFGRRRHFQIGEHPRRPRLEVPIEESRLFGEVGLELAARKARHDLEQDL